MAWKGLTPTYDGQRALNLAQLSNKIKFKSIVIGDGLEPENFEKVQGLVHQLYEITELKIDVTENGCGLTADFPKVSENYYFREIGIIVETEDGDKLYVYDNCGDDAQYIVNDSATITNNKRIRLSLKISGVAEMTVSEPQILYTTYEEFNAHVADEKRHITSTERINWNDAFNAVLYLVDTDNIEAAFYETFTIMSQDDPTAMTSAEIEEAISTEWDGTSSEDETAMSAEEIEEAISTEWNGESSEDETALSAEEISSVIS